MTLILVSNHGKHGRHGISFDLFGGYKEKAYFCSRLKKENGMNTMTIAIEDKGMMNVIWKVLTSIKGVSVLSTSEKDEKLSQTQTASSSRQGFYISPRIKALETGFSLPADFSDDYKKELADVREKRYL